MRRQSRAIRGDLERGIDAAIAGGDPRLAVMAVAFLAVLREGLEAARFMVAVGTQASGPEVATGAGVGLAVAIALGVAVALLQFQRSGDLPTAWGSLYDLTNHHLLTAGSEVGRFLGAMLGWDPRPSLEQVAVWGAYLAAEGLPFLRPGRRRREPAGT